MSSVRNPITQPGVEDRTTVLQRVQGKKHEVSVAFSSLAESVSLKGILVTGCLLVILFCSALGVVYSSHLSRQLFAEQALLQDRNDQLQLEWAQLLLEQGALSTPGRVERVAYEELNMSLPASEQVELLY